MKHFIEHPDLVEQYNTASAEERREQILLAFEAEYDINRPFSVDWAEGDTCFTYEGHVYFYKPQYPNGLDGVVTGETLVSQSPHLYEYKVE